MSRGIETQTAAKFSIAGELCELGRFPESIYLIALEGGKYAANNATTPDGDQANGLACFRGQQDAESYMALPEGKCIPGEIVARTFNECRDIAKEKEKLNCLLLFAAGRIVEIHYIQ